MARIPRSVVELLESIEEHLETVGVNSSSSAVVSLGKTSFELDAAACEKVFQSVRHVNDFFEALGNPSDAILELNEIDLECDVQDHLHEIFANVSEG